MKQALKYSAIFIIRIVLLVVACLVFIIHFPLAYIVDFLVYISAWLSKINHALGPNNKDIGPITEEELKLYFKELEL